MRRFAFLSLFALVVFSLAGCAAARTPVMGTAYLDVDAPVNATNSDAENLKTGKAKAKSYLGVVGLGDASINTAAEKGNISEIHHVDYNTKNFLGIYAETTTIVYGK